MDPNLIQLNVRRNAEDLQDYLRDLNNWEEEIKHKDKLLTEQKPILKKRLPPVRSKKRQTGKGKGEVNQAANGGKEKAQQSRISSFDYSSWDKFDVDAACEAIEENAQDSLPEDSNGSEEEEETQEERRKQIAVLEKERGNKLFKEGKHEAAVERYTRAMELDPTNAVLPANRAMALLKLERFAVAEEDCSLSLSLDQKYLKAWLRRATAREKLGKLAEAKQDFEKVLEMESGNKLAKSGLGSIQQKLAAPSQKKAVSPVVTSHTGPYVFPVKRPEHLRSKKPMKRIAIEEIGGVSEPQSAQVLVQNSSDRSLVSECLPPSSDSLHKEKRTSHVDGPQVKRAGKPASDDLQDESLVIQSKGEHSGPSVADAAATGEGGADSSLMAVPEPATSSILFQTHWKSLGKSRSQLTKYFQSISPSSYPVLLQQSLETNTFSDILSILEEHYVRAGKTCLEEMKWLTKVQRFQVAVMFLNRDDKQVVKNIFSGLGELLSGADEKQQLSTLARSYSISIN